MGWRWSQLTSGVLDRDLGPTGLSPLENPPVASRGASSLLVLHVLGLGDWEPVSSGLWLGGGGEPAGAGRCAGRDRDRNSPARGFLHLFFFFQPRCLFPRGSCSPAPTAAPGKQSQMTQRDWQSSGSERAGVALGGGGGRAPGQRSQHPPAPEAMWPPAWGAAVVDAGNGVGGKLRLRPRPWACRWGPHSERSWSALGEACLSGTPRAVTPIPCLPPFKTTFGRKHGDCRQEAFSTSFYCSPRLPLFWGPRRWL